MKPSIIFLFPYPLNEAPSQRFRFVQYLDILKERGYRFETHAYLSDNAWKILYHPGHFFSKFLRIIRGYLNRLLLLPKIAKFDYVFIHREAAPLGPPIIEFLIAKVLRKKIIYDFDDAIWLPNFSESNKFFSFICYCKCLSPLISIAAPGDLVAFCESNIFFSRNFVRLVMGHE